MHATTSAKLLSLTAQFCKSVPSKAAALVVLGVLPTTVNSPTVMTTLTEAALQAYLNHCGSEENSGGGAELLDFASEPLAVMGAAMASAPELSLDVAIERCIAQQAPLSLRLLLALQLSLLDDTSSMAWMPAAVAAVTAASRCGVPAAREFVLLLSGSRSSTWWPTRRIWPSTRRLPTRSPPFRAASKWRAASRRRRRRRRTSRRCRARECSSLAARSSSTSTTRSSRSSTAGFRARPPSPSARRRPSCAHRRRRC